LRTGPATPPPHGESVRGGGRTRRFRDGRQVLAQVFFVGEPLVVDVLDQSGNHQAQGLDIGRRGGGGAAIVRRQFGGCFEPAQLVHDAIAVRGREHVRSVDAVMRVHLAVVQVVESARDVLQHRSAVGDVVDGHRRQARRAQFHLQVMVTGVRPVAEV